MGTSTNGQICFGIMFEEGYQFPWDLEPYNGDIAEWWSYKIKGYKDPIKIYDEKGNI